LVKKMVEEDSIMLTTWHWDWQNSIMLGRTDRGDGGSKCLDCHVRGRKVRGYG
jgi:hypothetical protein